MRSFSVACGLALVANVCASPKQACVKNQCYAAVSGNFINGFASERVGGCSSYLQTTVTPTPVTETSTVVTTTGVTVTSVNTVTAHVTSVATVTSTTTSVTTELDATTNTIVDSATVTKLKTVHGTTTVPGTKTAVTTVFTTVPGRALLPRNVKQPKQANKGCPAPGGQNNIIPAFAVACKNAAAFESACACFNVQPQTKTAPACTTTVYTTSTVTTTRTAKQTSTVFITDTVTSTTTKTKKSTVTDETTVNVYTTATQTATAYTTTFDNTVTSIATTVTRTATSTVTAKPTVCNNQGLQFAVYSNINGPNHPSAADPNYSAFTPQDYKTIKPLCTGTTTIVGGISYSAGSTSSLNIYSQCKTPSTYYVINHRGYIYAPISGGYRFTLGAVDDVANIWVNGKAYSGWTRANDNIDLTLGQTPKPYVITLQGGTYNSIRIIYGQAQGAASFSLSVALPNGTAIVNSKTGASPYLIQQGCGSALSAAPAYPPFGKET